MIEARFAPKLGEVRFRLQHPAGVVVPIRTVDTRTHEQGAKPIRRLALTLGSPDRRG
jgi:hypothetical protein